MRVRDVLAAKGSDVVSVPPDCAVAGLVAVLAEQGVGAAVVSTDGRAVEGIVSERDVVRALAELGPAVLQEPVSRLATQTVHTVEPDARLDDLMRTMTDERVRHLPVVADGVLLGIVSIGDVVKRRIDQLEDERAALDEYVHSGG